MPPSSPTFEAEPEVPSRASMADSTRLTMTLKSTKYQYSLRLDLPPNKAYFFSASRYQPIRNPPRRSRSLPVAAGAPQRGAPAPASSNGVIFGELRRTPLLRGWVNKGVLLS